MTIPKDPISVDVPVDSLVQTVNWVRNKCYYLGINRLNFIKVIDKILKAPAKNSSENVVC